MMGIDLSSDAISRSTQANEDIATDCTETQG
jgi:hypothetical protein